VVKSKPRLTSRQLMFADGLKSGKNLYRAAIDAGYSEASARNSKTLLRVAVIHCPAAVRAWELETIRQRTALSEGASISKIAKVLGISDAILRRRMWRM